MLNLNFRKTLNGANGKINLNIKATIEKGEFIGIVGESGAGKTSILRILGGLDVPDSGNISVGNKIWFDKNAGINLSPQKRNIGFVFQDYALFPHFSVFKNLAFGTKNIQKINEILEIMNLQNLKHKMPHELSGGQKQRVALARGLVNDKQILLLDEPMSALDSKMRQKLQDELIKIHKLFNLTIILVSHDICEISRLSNRIFNLENGMLKSIKSFGDELLSAKFSFYAKIIDIQKVGIIFVVKILVNNKISIITMGNDALDYKIGEEVLVASKAFNPIILKL